MKQRGWLMSSVVAAWCAAGCAMDGAPATDTETAADTSGVPMGFARVAGDGTVSTAFDSLSPNHVTVTHTTGSGGYTVTFQGLGTALTDATGGNAQVVAEGNSNASCHLVGWSGTPNVSVSLACQTPGGAAAETPFSVMFYRYAMPAPNSNPLTIAYSFVTATGTVSPLWDFNSTGTHNTVTKIGTGAYYVSFPGGNNANASMMVSPYGGAMCTISIWGVSAAIVDCFDRTGVPMDSAFSISRAQSGPPINQQGGHAWWDGSTVPAAYAAGEAQVDGCPVTFAGSNASGLVALGMTGTLGSFDGSSFKRASFVTGYSASAMYCKVQALSTVGTTSTTTVHCYDATGTTVPTPKFSFTQVTSDFTAPGPC